jgi:hypothetical protein
VVVSKSVVAPHGAVIGIVPWKNRPVRICEKIVTSHLCRMNLYW